MPCCTSVAPRTGTGKGDILLFGELLTGVTNRLTRRLPTLAPVAVEHDPPGAVCLVVAGQMRATLTRRCRALARGEVCCRWLSARGSWQQCDRKERTTCDPFRVPALSRPREASFPAA